MNKHSHIDLRTDAMRKKRSRAVSRKSDFCCTFEPLRIEHCRSHAVCLPLSGLVICVFFLCFREFACHYQSMDAIACLEKFVYETYNLSSGMSNLTRSFRSYSLPKNLVFIAS